MSELRHVSFFPHVHTKTDTTTLMADVAIALLLRACSVCGISAGVPCW